MKIGYARVSTHDQNQELQTDALEQAGCKKIFSDKLSGAIASRPGLDAALNYARQNDCFVVWRLDRLGRSLKNLIQLVEDLDNKGVGFISLNEGLNTTTNGGKLIFHIFGALAEFERNLIRERTKAGLEAARARGRKGGRKEKLTSDQVDTMRRMYESHNHTIKEICGVFGITKPTFYRYLKED